MHLGDANRRWSFIEFRNQMREIPLISEDMTNRPWNVCGMNHAIPLTNNDTIFLTQAPGREHRTDYHVRGQLI